MTDTPDPIEEIRKRHEEWVSKYGITDDDYRLYLRPYQDRAALLAKVDELEKIIAAEYG